MTSSFDPLVLSPCYRCGIAMDPGLAGSLYYNVLQRITTYYNALHKFGLRATGLRGDLHTLRFLGCGLGGSHLSIIHVAVA